ncbi:unnamed protein product [Blepharisma stoltei]|uniref:FYVE-type domain-containing protein n=1 Tax=Blepharisma stoltei TaxID=1481888 RepID=A0AAU9J572_9CILI|nr:unnamed protein product [Blepharisma stoltei]
MDNSLSDYDYLHKGVASFTAPSVEILRVKELLPNLNENAWKSQSKCNHCKTHIRRNAALIEKLHVCRFCFNAFCSACSCLIALHPETHDLQRICVKCYWYFLRKNIKSQYKNEIEGIINEESQKRKEITQEKEKIIEEIKNCKENIEQLKREYKNLHSKIFAEKANTRNNGNASKVSDRVVINELLKKLKEQELDIVNVKNEVELMKTRKNNTINMNPTCLECSIF